MDTEIIMDLMKDPANYEEKIADMEKLLSDNGMPGKCTITFTNNAEARHGDKTAKLLFSTIKGHTDEKLRVDEGSAPQKNDEIAVTKSSLEALDAGIGDRITVNLNGREYEFIITGTYSAFETNGVF
ncbi:hypothetical protein RCJ22_00905, partial [Vibrio sp. FNV 38]|nr:hypothetical protein [Vibrio sp. FNV 38]